MTDIPLERSRLRGTAAYAITACGPGWASPDAAAWRGRANLLAPRGANDLPGPGRAMQRRATTGCSLTRILLQGQGHRPAPEDHDAITY
jgi:hypothetical protein